MNSPTLEEYKCPTFKLFHYSNRFGDTFFDLYEDFGPGCIFRIWITNWPIKSFLHFTVDGETFTMRIENMINATSWPFFLPFSTRHKQSTAGGGSYIPLCYKSYFRIRFKHHGKLPSNYLQDLVKCGRDLSFYLNDNPERKKCTWRSYVSISRHKYTLETPIDSFANILAGHRKGHASFLKSVARVLNKPGANPPSSDKCELQCFKLTKGKLMQLLRMEGSHVITTIRIRVLDHQMATPSDWNHVTLRMRFDESYEPQVKDIPLGLLFGASQTDGSLNDFPGAMIGRQVMSCNYVNYQNKSATCSSYEKFKRAQWTGYIYFPMPFWKSVEVSLKSSASGYRPAPNVCVQFTMQDNFYNPTTSAYFHIKSSFFIDNGEGWKELLKVKDTWGHMVGITSETNDIDPTFLLGDIIAQRAAVEEDFLFHIDESWAASLRGSGSEDYFGYGHEAIGAENKSYPFVGNPYSNIWTTRGCVSRLFYRQQPLDPIPFHQSLSVIVEGYQGKETNRHQQLGSITVEQYYARKMKQLYTSAFLIFLYA